MTAKAIGRNRRLVLATVVAAILVATAAVAITGAFAGEQKLSAGAFHDAMRKIWEDHVTWTRLAIVSLVAGLADTNATVGRLMQNQADIGNAIRPFYWRRRGRPPDGAPEGPHRHCGGDHPRRQGGEPIRRG